jgi:cardiolipin synthase
VSSTATRPTDPSPADRPKHDRARRERIDEMRRSLEGIIGVPATEGNAVEVLRNGDRIFPSMLDAIEGAERTIDFLTFVYWEGEIGTRFAHALADRAAAGVRVRVLLDGWGCHPIEHSLIDLMSDAGAQVHWFRPLHRGPVRKINHRTHRKLMIVDEGIGFTGGVGIADEWQGDARNEDEWRDTHFRIRGPAVDGLRAAFLDNWIETDPVLFDRAFDRFPDQPQPGGTLIQSVRGAAETGWSDISTLFIALLGLAEERVRLSTAYFVPDGTLIDQLVSAAERGVEIQILVPGPHADKRFVQLAGEGAFEPLLDAGIRIWSYQTSMMHAKVMTVDGVVANVGSANFNSRSTELDEEINLVALDPELVRILDEDFDRDLEASRAIEPGHWQRRSLVQRASERVSRWARHTI